MSKIWRKIPGFVGCKYLVVRRDGTVPEWPWFVLGGDDVSSPTALRAYAKSCEMVGCDPKYVASLYELADEWGSRPYNPKSNPDGAPHRTDNPAIVAMMEGGGDLKEYAGPTQTYKRASGLFESVANVAGTVEAVAAGIFLVQGIDGRWPRLALAVVFAVAAVHSWWLSDRLYGGDWKKV